MTRRNESRPRKRSNTHGSKNHSWTTVPKLIRSDWRGKRKNGLDARRKNGLGARRKTVGTRGSGHMVLKGNRTGPKPSNCQPKVCGTSFSLRSVLHSHIYCIYWSKQCMRGTFHLRSGTLGFTGYVAMALQTHEPIAQRVWHQTAFSALRNSYPSMPYPFLIRHILHFLSIHELLLYCVSERSIALSLEELYHATGGDAGNGKTHWMQRSLSTLE